MMPLPQMLLPGLAMESKLVLKNLVAQFYSKNFCCLSCNVQLLLTSY